MPKPNPYEPSDLATQAKELAEIQERIKQSAKLGSECLADKKFIKYKEDFERMRRDIFGKLALPLDVDPIKDAHYLRACINSILILDMLVEKPRKDLRKER